MNIKNVIISTLFILSFKSFASEVIIFNGYDFDKYCAHGNYLKSPINTAGCGSALMQSSDAIKFFHEIGRSKDLQKCYEVYYTTKIKMDNLSTKLNDVENFYNNHTDKLNYSIFSALLLISMDKYPLPKVCSHLASKKINI